MSAAGKATTSTQKRPHPESAAASSSSSSSSHNPESMDLGEDEFDFEIGKQDGLYDSHAPSASRNKNTGILSRTYPNTPGVRSLSAQKDEQEVMEYINPAMKTLKSMLEKKSKLVESLEHHKLQFRNGVIPKPLQIADQSKQISKDSPELREKIKENTKEYEKIRFNSMIQSKEQSLAKLDQDLINFPKGLTKSFVDSINMANSLSKASDTDTLLINDNITQLFIAKLQEEMMRVLRKHAKATLLTTQHESAKKEKQEREAEMKANMPELTIEQKIELAVKQQLLKLNKSHNSSSKKQAKQAKQAKSKSTTPKRPSNKKQGQTKSSTSSKPKSKNGTSKKPTKPPLKGKANDSGSPKPPPNKRNGNGSNNRSNKPKKK